MNLVIVIDVMFIVVYNRVCLGVETLVYPIGTS